MKTENESNYTSGGGSESSRQSEVKSHTCAYSALERNADKRQSVRTEEKPMRKEKMVDVKYFESGHVELMCRKGVWSVEVFGYVPDKDNSSVGRLLSSGIPCVDEETARTLFSSVKSFEDIVTFLKENKRNERYM